jgi:hypothetical protein
MNKTRSLLLLAAVGGALAFATTARADPTLVINRQITSLTRGTGLQISFDFVPPPHQAPSDFSFQSLAGADYLTFIGNEPSSVVSLEPVPGPSSILMLGSAMIFLGWALQKRNDNQRRLGRLGFTSTL